IAVAESVILPKPDRKLRRGLRSMADMSFSRACDASQGAARQAGNPRRAAGGCDYFLLRLHPPAVIGGSGSEAGESVGQLLNLRRGLAQIGATSSVGPRPTMQGASFDPLAVLLADIALGNDRAFARLYELTGGRLLAIIRGIVGRADVAED